MSVRVGEDLFIAAPSLETVVLLDDSVVQLTRTPAGISLRGVATGRTQAQLYTSTGLRVLVVSVQPAPPKPRPANAEAQVTPGQRGPLRSFWGLNSYTADVTWNSLLGVYTRHALSLSGLVQGGEYDLDAQAMFGALGSRFQRGRLAWMNASRNFSFSLGDSAMQIPGSEVTPALPVRGLHLRSGNDRFTKELFLGGSTAGGSDGFDQPLLGGTLSGAVPLGKSSSWTFRHAESVVGFLSGESAALPSHLGVLAGTRLRLEQRQRFSLELRSTGEVATPRRDGPPTSTGGELGASATLNEERWGAHVDYQGSFGTLYLPMAGMYRWPAQRIGGGFNFKVGSSFFGNATGSYAVLWDEQGRSTDGVSGHLGLQYYLSANTRFQLQAAQVGSAFLVGTGDDTRLIRTQQRFASLTAGHQFDPFTLGQVSLSYHQNQNGRGGRRHGMTLAAVASRQRTTWQLSASASVTGFRDDVIAEDRPLVIQGSASVNGRLVFGRFESFGGISLQREFVPGLARGVGGNVNVGIQFAPTIAHRLIASYTLSHPLAAGDFNHNVSASYTFLFGDSVRAPPIFEFLSHGRVRGRVCLDEDLNGECEPTESGLPGVAVRLSNGKTTKSDAKGSYIFDDVKPGFYHVEVDEKALRAFGRMTTTPRSGIELADRGDVSTRFGVFQGCEVLGRVVSDLDLDGQRSGADSLVPNVKLTVAGEGQTYTTDSDGFGTFNVRVKKCGDYTVTLDEGSLPPQYRVIAGSAQLKTESRERSSGVDLFVSAIRTLSGTVFFDANRNGVREAHEPTVTGAKVFWSGGNAASNDGGKFLLRRLPAGRILLQVHPASVPAEMRSENGLEVLLPETPTTREGLDFPLTPRANAS
ncbi:MAG: SdrD B-like domain-containing protein [Myxococcaceae bacterium]